MSFKDNISKFYPIIIIGLGILICTLMIILKPVAKPDEVKFPDPFVQVKKIFPELDNTSFPDERISGCNMGRTSLMRSP